MKALRVAAVITMVGGFMACFRLFQALAVEISYEGSHDLFHTVPMFLAFAAFALGAIWCGVFFINIPTKRNASRVIRLFTVSSWILLANIGVGLGLSAILIGAAYFLVLKPAVVREFGRDEGPNEALQPTAVPGRG